MGPTTYQNLAHLNTMVPASTHQASFASQFPRFTNAGADMGTRPVANNTHASVFPIFAQSQHASPPPGASQNTGHPSQASQYANNPPQDSQYGYPSQATQYANNALQVNPYGSLNHQYKPTIPMPSQQSMNSRPPGTIVKTESYTPAMKATISTNPQIIISPSTQRKASMSQTIRPPPSFQQPSSTTKPLQQLPAATYYQTKPPTSPHGPIKTASIYTSPTDLRMATLQRTISSMPPNSTALKKQQKWVQSIIPILTTNTCPEGNKFKRIDPSPSSPNSSTGGYQCAGGRHFISDELIASGSPGVYLLLDPTDASYLAGPYFPSSDDPRMLLYSGDVPKTPPHAPDWLSGSRKGNFHPKTKEKENVWIGRTILRAASDRDILNIAKGLGVVGVSAKVARRKCEDYVDSTA